ncbi:MAG: DUF559 domain-containing protein [Pseudonocardia sp.]
MPTSSKIAALLVRQDGLLTLAQAHGAGMSTSTVQRRVRTGEWQRVAPRVFLSAGHPLTDRARVRAAGLWAGGRGTVCGPAAAFWHGMRSRPPEIVDVTVPRGCGLRAHAGVQVRRRDLDPADLLLTGGIRIADAALAALETAATVPEGSVFLDRALQRHVRFPSVYRAYCRNVGARGWGRVGELLVVAADRADSAAERRLIALLRRAGIDSWVRGHPFQRWTIDIAFPRAQLAIEVDGWAWHMDVDRFRADRHKGNALARAGWDLLRFTWHDLENRPAYVIGEIRAALVHLP